MAQSNIPSVGPSLAVCHQAFAGDASIDKEPQLPVSCTVVREITDTLQHAVLLSSDAWRAGLFSAVLTYPEFPSI